MSKPALDAKPDDGVEVLRGEAEGHFNVDVDGSVLPSRRGRAFHLNQKRNRVHETRYGNIAIPTTA